MQLWMQRDQRWRWLELKDQSQKHQRWKLPQLWQQEQQLWLERPLKQDLPSYQLMRNLSPGHRNHGMLLHCQQLVLLLYCYHHQRRRTGPQGHWMLHLCYCLWPWTQTQQQQRLGPAQYQ